MEVHKSHGSEINATEIVSPGNCTIQLPYSVVHPNEWSARVTLCLKNIEWKIICEMFLTLPRKYSHKFPKRTELHFQQVLNEFCTQSHLWLIKRPSKSVEIKHVILLKTVHIVTPPFEEVLLSHTVWIAEILSPSLILQPDGQPAVRLLANRLSLFGANMSNQSHVAVVAMLHHIPKVRASLKYNHGVPLFWNMTMSKFHATFNGNIPVDLYDQTFGRAHPVHFPQMCPDWLSRSSAFQMIMMHKRLN